MIAQIRCHHVQSAVVQITVLECVLNGLRTIHHVYPTVMFRSMRFLVFCQRFNLNQLTEQ
jgi:hypothetical protein